MNAECAGCGITAADLPYEEMGLSLDEASEFLFEDGLCQGCVTSPVCQYRSHSRPEGNEPCDCEARLAAVVAHHVVDDPAIGPPFCQECSEAISEYVPWDTSHQARVLPPEGGES